MNLEAILIASIPGSLALMAVLVGAWKDKNKPKVDETSAYAALTHALKTSGNTIDDLFKMLAEVPDLKDQVNEMQDELEDLRLGVGILTAQLVRARLTPEWKPKPRKIA